MVLAEKTKEFDVLEIGPLSAPKMLSLQTFAFFTVLTTSSPYPLTLNFNAAPLILLLWSLSIQVHFGMYGLVFLSSSQPAFSCCGYQLWPQ